MAHSGNHLQNNIGHDNHGDAALLPHLESFEKMMKLPVVEAAWHQGQDVYGKVKGKPSSLTINFRLKFYFDFDFLSFLISDKFQRSFSKVQFRTVSLQRVFFISINRSAFSFV